MSLILVELSPTSFNKSKEPKVVHISGLCCSIVPVALSFLIHISLLMLFRDLVTLGNGVLFY